MLRQLESVKNGIQGSFSPAKPPACSYSRFCRTSSLKRFSDSRIPSAAGRATSKIKFQALSFLASLRCTPPTPLAEEAPTRTRLTRRTRCLYSHSVTHSLRSRPTWSSHDRGGGGLNVWLLAREKIQSTSMRYLSTKNHRSIGDSSLRNESVCKGW